MSTERNGAEPVESVDAIVVGSGFGGAVSAYRLAEAGHQVVLLERGRKYPPGSFPRTPAALGRAFWDPSEGLHGLFDVWSFRSIEAIVASGFGGGSLVYANVMLRKDENWFVQDTGPSDGCESWPVTRADLEECYDRAEDVLGVANNPYPHRASTPKTIAMERAARRLGIEWFRPPLAVAFAGAGARPGDPIPGQARNIHGATRLTCNLCGSCDIGCNTGSKNTLDFTYLSRAGDAGADLRERCEVRTVTPVAGGYEVTYVRHEPENEDVRLDTSRLPPHRIRARIVVFGAGSLGSTYLLLRNRHALPALGPALGTRFSGNGDLLGFVTGSPDALEASTGPVITSTMRVADALDEGGTGRGFYLQDGGYPGFVDWIVQSAGFAGVLRRAATSLGARLLDAATGTPRSAISARVAAVLGDGAGARGSLPLLGMGRDVPDGALGLRGRWLDVDWSEASSRPYLDRLTATMRAVAAELGGDFTANPTRTLGRLITVHPLGGCPMGVDVRRGVVDAHGEAFGHPGLFVADGSVMPGPVGANPSLTIAALAERFSGRMLERLASRPALAGSAR